MGVRSVKRNGEELREAARAAAEAGTRRRITEAAVELHGTVGPARTTVAELARQAGVSRVTVYNHFPDDAALLSACSAHWAERHPPPDLSAWAAIADADERLLTGLGELYEWYAENEAMLANSERDAAVLPRSPRLRARRTTPFREAMLELLAPGRGRRAPRPRGRRARAAHLADAFSPRAGAARGRQADGPRCDV